jgi:basic membrane protein A
VIKARQKGVQFDDTGETGIDESAMQEKKVMLVQSYWTNYKWGIDIEKGVLEALGLPASILDEEPVNKGGLGLKEGIAAKTGKYKISLKIVNMDTKRRSEEEWKKESGIKTIGEIEAFKPDVVILADDNAQQYVGKAIVGRYPIVFCGVNNEYTDYYKPGEEMTGLHERMNFKETEELLLEVFPDITKVILLTDATETSSPVVDQITMVDLPIADLETYQFASFDKYKTKVKSLQKAKNTAIAIFNLNFEGTTQEEAIAWTVENSTLPEMTFQTNTVEGGLLLTSAVSGMSHGKEAVEKALRILGGEKASSIPVSVPSKGDVAINQKRAAGLGVTIPVSILNTAIVYE